MMLHSALETLRRRPLLGMLALLLLAEVFWIGWAASQPVETPLLPAEEVTSASVTLSEISGPSIGAQAAFAALCQSLPVDMWLFLLTAFALLLAYNLSAALREERHAGRQGPVWRFELLLLLITLVAWCAWDGCRTYPWFPLSAVKLALLLYAGYLALREEGSQSAEPAQKEALF